MKKITIILSLICFIYQLIKLTLEFTEFKTTIHVELLKDDLRLSDSALSVCTYQLNTDSIEVGEDWFIHFPAIFSE